MCPTGARDCHGWRTLLTTRLPWEHIACNTCTGTLPQRSSELLHHHRAHSYGLSHTNGPSTGAAARYTALRHHSTRAPSNPTATGSHRLRRAVAETPPKPSTRDPRSTPATCALRRNPMLTKRNGYTRTHTCRKPSRPPRPPPVPLHFHNPSAWRPLIVHINTTTVATERLCDLLRNTSIAIREWFISVRASATATSSPLRCLLMSCAAPGSTPPRMYPRVASSRHTHPLPTARSTLHEHEARAAAADERVPPHRSTSSLGTPRRAPAAFRPIPSPKPVHIPAVQGTAHSTGPHEHPTYEYTDTLMHGLAARTHTRTCT